jgi:hypothetical protein
MSKIATVISENHYMILACLCMFTAQACVWFSSNSQIVWDWWADKPLLAAILFGVPASLLFWHGTKYGFAAMNELWGPRFLGFGMSYLTFPILTWWFASESMFTAKTMVCVLLSFTIVGIQIFWK